jgi:hypothetical protein|tara:strand:+ start:141 stop:929 length:789 start_codon:yes stop_codon:yes gene_type:complete
MTAWPEHSKNWNKLGPPLKPSPITIDTYAKLIPTGPIILLGVTPEIYHRFDNILAIDYNTDMIKNVWPGNTETKIAISDDWRQVICKEQYYSGIVGDLSLTLMDDLDTVSEFNQKSLLWLKDKGVMAQRIFHLPSTPVTRDKIVDMMNNPATINWHAFKWLLHMCLSNETSVRRVRQADVRDMFNEICTDRQKLSDITGWSLEAINTIDFYENATQEITVATKDEWLKTVPANATETSLIYTHTPGYDLSELFPILTYKRNV